MLTEHICYGRLLHELESSSDGRGSAALVWVLTRFHTTCRNGSGCEGRLQTKTVGADLVIGVTEENVALRELTDGSPILGCFSENYEFSPGRGHALCLQQQIAQVFIAASAAQK